MADRLDSDSRARPFLDATSGVVLCSNHFKCSDMDRRYLMRKLTYYVGASIDGYIAGPGGEVDFYPVAGDMMEWINARYPETVPRHIRELVGLPVDTPNQRWDTLVMGRGTYDPALEIGIASPYPHMKQYVVSA